MSHRLVDTLIAAAISTSVSIYATKATISNQAYKTLNEVHVASVKVIASMTKGEAASVSVEEFPSSSFECDPHSPDVPFFQYMLSRELFLTGGLVMEIECTINDVLVRVIQPRSLATEKSTMPLKSF